MNIKNKQKDFTVGVLVQKISNNDIMLQPDFQRSYVYSDAKASYLIESMLIDMPIPSIYLYEQKDYYEVIDGQQRLTTIKRFLNNEFYLRKMKVLRDLEGKYFKDLDKEYKKKFEDFCFKTIIVQADNENIKYELFERLNTGASSLNAQEIRNCIYRGEFNNLLRRIVNDPDLRKQLFRKNRQNKRMKLEEEVLFLLWYLDCMENKSYPSHNCKVKRQIANDFMKARKDIDKDTADELFGKYKKIFTDAYDLFGTLIQDVGGRYIAIDLMYSYERKYLEKYRYEIVDIINDIRKNNLKYINYSSGCRSGHLISMENKHQIIKDEINKFITSKEGLTDFLK